MHAPGVWGILIVGMVVVLLFGRGKISGLMGEVASGIKAFRVGLKDDAKPDVPDSQNAADPNHPEQK